MLADTLTYNSKRISNHYESFIIQENNHFKNFIYQIVYLSFPNMVSLHSSFIFDQNILLSGYNIVQQ